MDATLINSPYLLACRNKPSPRVPIWVMRQAGRYMKCYRDVRERYDFLTMVRTPELACQITLQPVDAFAPDAAIIFSDILPLLDAMGLGLEFLPGDGPIIKRPIKTVADIDNLLPVEPYEQLASTLKAIQLTKKELRRHEIPLIGFSGAPFTLAIYAIEGGSSASFVNTMSLMLGAPEQWHRLMDKIKTAVISYLSAQVESGADALQLFDSWAGILSPRQFETYVLPHVCEVIEALKPCNVPITYFSTQTTSYLDLLSHLPCQVLGIDWRIDIGHAWRKKSPHQALQGNLSPNVLLGSEDYVRREVRQLLRDVAAITPFMQGYIFNLGHGIHKETPMSNVMAMFEEVRKFSVMA